MGAKSSCSSMVWLEMLNDYVRTPSGGGTTMTHSSPEIVDHHIPFNQQKTIDHVD